MSDEYSPAEDCEALGIEFTRNAEALAEATKEYRYELIGFEPREWITIKDNIALIDAENNYAMFEKGDDGYYTGHYFFNARGRKALRIAKAMLYFLFSHTDIKVVRGLTPLQKLGARWMSRQLGFKSYGVVHTQSGPCELFILVKEQ